MSEGEFCAQARVPGLLSFVWGPRRKVDSMRRRVSPVFSFQIRILCRNAMSVINAVKFAFFDILGGTPILIVYRYLRVPGCFFCGSFLMVSADRLAWQNSSVAVSVIVLGLSRWLVTCFFGCSGARDISTLCDLRVPGVLECRSCRYVGCPGADVVAWFAQFVTICVSPVLWRLAGWLAWLTDWRVIIRLSRSRSSSWACPGG